MRVDQDRAAPGIPDSARKAAVLTVVCAAQFMVVLDISVVNVALPSIRTSLGLSDVALGWVVNAYALVFAGLLLLGGRLADLFGRRRMLLAGLGVFAAASLAGGLADSGAWLIGARAVQGLGAAVTAPVTLAILTATFAEGRARTRALAVWTALGLAGGTVGNLLGGVLTEWGSWRSTLLINVPIALVAIIVAVWVIAVDRPVAGGGAGRAGGGGGPRRGGGRAGGDGAAAPPPRGAGPPQARTAKTLGELSDLVADLQQAADSPPTVVPGPQSGYPPSTRARPADSP
ncbi:MFS transporter, partial [Nocardia carnea]|uniref:MFS transporter n=1 Tax=Nocardia carnea TaxID=37328 RepID=UPI0024577F23